MPLIRTSCRLNARVPLPDPVELKEMMKLHFLLRGLLAVRNHLAEFVKRLAAHTQPKRPPLMSVKERKKKVHMNSLLDKEQGEKYSIHLLFILYFSKAKKNSPIFPGDLFNEMTSFLQDSELNGFHTTLLATGGFRAPAGKRAISSTRSVSTFPRCHLNS